MNEEEKEKLKESPLTNPAHIDVEGKGATQEVLEDTKARYLAYLNRVRTAFTAGSRYLAYTSDVGEAFRPLTKPIVVRTAYGISWAYVIGDVALDTWRERQRGSTDEIVLRTGTKRAIFQSTASMILPAITIHQTVHLASYFFKNATNKYVRMVPSMVGLAVIPFLPIYDHPVEHAIDYLYDRFWPVPEAAHQKKAEHGQKIEKVE
eukprot:TRINITY_DN4351_c0_g1_i2.p1 TRINITY_DN4351_c0_g1~~TRINITY_DN4351_c0_g1_i2.p1  ORF type:complete len:234 (-),score=45.17 TRINITY_DN4351_c0_g1_i2:136-753(-)